MAKKRTKEDMKKRIKSNQSFKIFNPDRTLFAHMEEGKWIKKPKK